MLAASQTVGVLIFDGNFSRDMFYLPGPAVGIDILSSNHLGQQRGEGGLATPVRWGDRRVHKTLSRHSVCGETDILSVNRNGVVWKRSLPPATKRAKTTNFIMSVSPDFAAKHPIYLYLSGCYATKNGSNSNFSLWQILIRGWSQVGVKIATNGQ